MRLPETSSIGSFCRRYARRGLVAAGLAATVAATMGQYNNRVKTWWEADDVDTLPLFASFQDHTGELHLYNYGGPVSAQENAFFQSVGTNGRACVTCHQPANAMSLSTDTLKTRWDETHGKDPVFAAIDGSNCPTLPQAEKSSHSLLLNRGLFRIYLPWPAKGADGQPITPEFTIEVVRDPTGCNNDPVYGLHSEHPTISVYRRPRMAANLKYVLGGADGFSLESHGTAVLQADGRESTLAGQAADAVIAHMQGKTPLTPEQMEQILAFEQQVYTAQGEDVIGGDLGEVDGPKGLDVWNMARAKVEKPVADTGAVAGTHAVFLTPLDWHKFADGKAHDASAEFRASVVRGNEIFSTRPFIISGTANLNGHPAGRPVEGTCQTCHKAAMTGADPGQSGIDIGTTVLPTTMDSPDLPLFKLTCNAGSSGHPYRGRVVLTNDPGRALTTGKCSDIGSVVMQQFRGLSARAPYFVNGSAKDLGAVVDYYDQRFEIHLTEQERQDLVNFMSVL